MFRSTPHCFWSVTGEGAKGEDTNVPGEPGKVSIQATNLFRKEDGKWKMIGLHTDLLPYLPSALWPTLPELRKTFQRE